MMCTCAMHCADNCEPQCCPPWARCPCWCHKDRWRVQCWRGGVVFHESSGPGLANEGRALFEQLAKEHKLDADNVELQERPAGKRRYQPVEQAVGERRIQW